MGQRLREELEEEWLEPAPSDFGITPIEPDHLHDIVEDRRVLKLRLADSAGRRADASMLIKRRYEWRGYAASHLSEGPDRISLVAGTEACTIGTITLGIDGKAGLSIDELYKPEADKLRAEGRTLGEVTKLAVDAASGSKRCLAGLFHVAYIFGRILERQTDFLIEVNPRHVGYYRRMLGFEQAGEEKYLGRVGAPAVLLRLDLGFAEQRIAQMGGHYEELRNERSLYPYFFAPHEEAAIVARICARSGLASVAELHARMHPQHSQPSRSSR